MSNDDLLRMLDLEGKEAPQQREALPIITAGEGSSDGESFWGRDAPLYQQETGRRP
jgi:hypothetical protein